MGRQFTARTPDYYVTGGLDLQHLPYRIGFSGVKGRGLFATRQLKTNVVLSNAPIIKFNADDTKRLNETLLQHYLFQDFEDPDASFMPLGHCLLLNHSLTPNVMWFPDPENSLLVKFKTVQPVNVDEELVTCYGYQPVPYTELELAI